MLNSWVRASKVFTLRFICIFAAVCCSLESLLNSHFFDGKSVGWAGVQGEQGEEIRFGVGVAVTVSLARTH